MGGGRTVEGAAIYRRVNGQYVRQVPYKNQPKEKSFRDKVKEAKTKNEIWALVTDKYGTKGVMRSTLMKSDLELYKRVVTTLDELEEQYPFMKGFVKGIRSRVTAVASMDLTDDSDGAYLKLNTSVWAADNARLHSMDPNERGYHPPHTSPESIIAHEFGHAIQHYITIRKKAEAERTGIMAEYEFWQKLQAGTVLDDVENKALRSLDMDANTARGGISGYAQSPDDKYHDTNTSPQYESFSEALADVYANGNNASRESKAYVQALIAEAERYGG